MSSSVPGPVPARPGSAERLPTYGFFALLAVLVLFRLPHLSGPIDEPHSPRQCDTAHYAEAFYQDGFDLLHPAVCWMGAHRTVILEFPLPEALMAAVYRVAGPGEDRARALTLLFFAGGACYLFFLIRRLYGPWTAVWSAGAYAVLPLAWFYSRALVIDLYVLFFVHAWAYHWLRALEERSTLHLLLGAAALAIGALIKAPLFLPIGLPVGAVVLFRARRDLPKYVLAGIAAVVPFLLWRWHTEVVNQAMPDWDFLPTYFKFYGSAMTRWYFGDWGSRLAAQTWFALGTQIRVEAITPLGLLLLLPGSAALLLGPKAGYPKGASRFFAFWLAGAAGYLLVFFTLNVIHDYYQLPLLSLLALGMGAGLELLGRLRFRTSPVPGRIVALLVFCLLAWSGWFIAEKGYYDVTAELVSAGQELRTRIPARSLLVVSTEHTDCRDPRLLYRSGHDGWAVSTKTLSGPLLQRLRQEGAAYLAILDREPPPVRTFLPPVLQEVALAVPPWRVRIYRLGDPENQ